MEKITTSSLIKQQIQQGEALFSEGKIEEAENHFRNLLNQYPENPDILNNLGVISHTRENIEGSIDYFTKALQIDPYNKDALMNYSGLLKELGLVKEIEPMIKNAVEKFPGDEELCQLLNESRSAIQPKPKVGVFCLPGLQSFLSDIVAHLSTKYDVRTCYSNNEQEIESTARWADIVWLEWANELAIHVSNKVSSVSQKQVICRIHSYEVLSGYPKYIQWSKISKSIFVSDHILKIALELCPSISQLTEPMVIHNGVNLRKFQFKERKPGYNIAIVGHINHKKNPSMWIEILSRLQQIDRRYTFKVAGQFQELRYKYYMESLIPKLGLTNNIKFFGQVDNIPKWFEINDINYLLSTSPFESFGYSIAEAMAMGYRPLIHAFPGSESIWPRDCLFGCADELIKLLQKGQSYNSMEYRRFVEEKYSLNAQLEKIDLLLKETASKISCGVSSSETRNEKETQAQQSSTLPTSHIRYNKPDKNFIVTGIPRSGTSLFSTLINSLENAVCLNEILYDVDSLPLAFAEIRRRIVAGEQIPNRYNKSGELATDTQQGGVDVENRVVTYIDKDVVIGSKVNIPYLNQIYKILDYGYRVFAIVRDPVYTIGSWNSKKARIIPEAHVTDGDMNPRWQGFNFTTDDRIERQAQIWQHYGMLLWKIRDKIRIIKYEDLIKNNTKVMQDVCAYLGLRNTITKRLENMNTPSRFIDLDMIRVTVIKHCPIASTFGYNHSETFSQKKALFSDSRNEKPIINTEQKPACMAKEAAESRENVLKPEPDSYRSKNIPEVFKQKVKLGYPDGRIGPFVIFGRGHCGGRVLCEAYVRNGVFMGKTSLGKMDTVGFGLENAHMLNIMKEAFSYPSSTREKQEEMEALVTAMVSDLASEADGRPFGWKHGISIFSIEMLLHAHREAKVVHLIRDGRDVMLSRLPARLNPDEIVKEHNKMAVFGRVDINSYKNTPLPLAVQDEKFRNELEMIHWKTATEFGLRGRRFKDQYIEIFYEDLCRCPIETMTKIFDFLGLTMKKETAAWAAATIHPRRIGKWKNRAEELYEAIALGEPLLSDLGYT